MSIRIRILYAIPSSRAYRSWRVKSCWASSVDTMNWRESFDNRSVFTCFLISHPSSVSWPPCAVHRFNIGFDQKCTVRVTVLDNSQVFSFSDWLLCDWLVVFTWLAAAEFRRGGGRSWSLLLSPCGRITCARNSLQGRSGTWVLPESLTSMICSWSANVARHWRLTVSSSDSSWSTADLYFFLARSTFHMSTKTAIETMASRSTPTATIQMINPSGDAFVVALGWLVETIKSDVYAVLYSVLSQI